VPDVLVAADGRTFAVRGADDRLAFHHGCIGRLADGSLFAYGLEPDAFAVVIAARDDPPADCAAAVIGRALWRARGALTLRRDGSGFVVQSARSNNFDRSWSPAPAAMSPAIASAPVAPAATPDVRAPDGAAKSVDDRAKPASEPKLRAGSNDATPREEDIESDE